MIVDLYKDNEMVKCVEKFGYVFLFDVFSLRLWYVYGGIFSVYKL